MALSLQEPLIRTLEADLSKFRTQAEVAREAAGEVLILRNEKRKLEAELKQSEKNVKAWYERCRRVEDERDALTIENLGLKSRL